MIFKKINTSNGLNMAWVIISVITISSIMVIASFIIFLNSGAYDTVQQISAANRSLEADDLEGYDTKSPVEPENLADYATIINSKIININDDNSFSNQAISEEELGY
jgi:cell division protein FtsL